MERIRGAQRHNYKHRVIMLGLLRHRRVAGLLSSYIDGQVTSAERRLIEGHLPGCDRCSRDLDGLRRTVSLMGALPELSPGRSYVLSSAHQTSPARRSAFPIWAPGIAAAACAVLLAVVISGQAVGLLVQSGDFGQESESYADEPAAEAALAAADVQEAAFDDSTDESSLLAEAVQMEAMSDELADFQESEEPELLDAAVSDIEAGIALEAMEATAAVDDLDVTSLEIQADFAIAEAEDTQMRMAPEDASQDLVETQEDAAELIDDVTEDPAEPDSEALALPLWQIQLGAAVALVGFAVAAMTIWLARLRRR